MLSCTTLTAPERAFSTKISRPPPNWPGLSRRATTLYPSSWTCSTAVVSQVSVRTTTVGCLSRTNTVSSAECEIHPRILYCRIWIESAVHEVLAADSSGKSRRRRCRRAIAVSERGPRLRKRGPGFAASPSVLSGGGLKSGETLISLQVALTSFASRE